MNDAVGCPAAPTPSRRRRRALARLGQDGVGRERESRRQRVPDPAPLRVGLGRRRHDGRRRGGRPARNGRELGRAARAARGRRAGRRRRVEQSAHAAEQERDDDEPGRAASRRGSVGASPHPSAGHDRTPPRPSATGSCGRSDPLTRSIGKVGADHRSRLPPDRPEPPGARRSIFSACRRPGPPAPPGGARGSAGRPARPCPPRGRSR